MKTTEMILAFALATVFAGSVFAQEPPPGGPGPGPDGRHRPPGGGPNDRPRDPGRPPLGPQAEILSLEMRFGDRLVKGLPYSADFVIENTRVLGDGTRITRKSTGSAARDSEGRTRREQTLGAVGPIAVEGLPRLAFINDPVAGFHYIIEEQNRRVRKLPFREAPPQPPSVPPELEGAADSIKTESLGTRDIEGLQAEGTRSVVTIPTGRVGNDRPLEIVSERWYSRELQIVVMSSHKDPFAGDNIYRLTNLNRGEPSKSLFDLPAGYAVVEDKPPLNNPPPQRGPRPE